LKVAKVYAEISDARKDFLHKLTTRLVRENQLIGVEDLSVKNLVKNHKLALSISDAAWGEAIRQLEYKCPWYGRTFVKKDFLHKLTTRLVRENQLIGVEDLSVKNLVKNHKLALSISDAAWGEAIRQLEYKCAWYGRTFVKIERWFPSSKRCSNCGYIIDKLPLNIREWDCPKCRVHHDRDENAGKNILAAFSCG